MSAATVADQAGAMDTTGTTGAAGAPGPQGPQGPYGPYPQPQPPRPQGDRGFFDSIRAAGIARTDDRWVAGVCGGVARRFGLDPLLVRGLFAVSVLVVGLGLVAYGVAWALLPEERDGRIHLQEAIAGRFDVALVGAIAMVVVGLGRGGGVSPFWFWDGRPSWLGDVFGWVGGLLWIAFLVVVVVAVVTAVQNRKGGVPAPTDAPAPGAAADAPRAGDAGAAGGSAAAAQAGWSVSTASSAPAAPAGPTVPTVPARPAPTPYGPYGPYPAPGSTHPSGPTGAPAGQPWGTPGPARPVPPPAPVRVAAPPAPPRPPRPRPSGPGAATVGVVVSLTILALAALLLAERADRFDGPVLLTTIGVGVVLAGLGIIVSGLRGRTSGSLGALAVLGVLAAGPVGVATHSGWTPEGVHRWEASSVTLTTRTDAANGVNLGLGDATVDLSQVPLDASTLDVPVSIGAGNLTVVLPADAAVSANVRMGAGEVRWQVDDASETRSGVGLGNATFDDGSGRTPQLHVDVSAGVGDVTIVREDS